MCSSPKTSQRVALSEVDWPQVINSFTETDLVKALPRFSLDFRVVRLDLSSGHNLLRRKRQVPRR